MKLGRLDSLTASQDNSSTIMPSPRSTATALVGLFHKYNLSPRDTVALSGSHSIGNGRCFSIMYRLYNQSGSGKPDPVIDPGYLTVLNELCPQGGDQNVTGDLDSTPRKFDNWYFKDLVHGKGFLNSDQTLYRSPETRDYVVEFSNDQDAFFKAFVEGMIKLGDLVYDNPGEIRKNCRLVNVRSNEMLVVS